MLDRSIRVNRSSALSASCLVSYHSHAPRKKILLNEKYVEITYIPQSEQKLWDFAVSNTQIIPHLIILFLHRVATLCNHFAPPRERTLPNKPVPEI